jgi:hypothetical protein
MLEYSPNLQYIAVQHIIQSLYYYILSIIQSIIQFIMELRNGGSMFTTIYITYTKCYLWHGVYTELWKQSQKRRYLYITIWEYAIAVRVLLTPCSNLQFLPTLTLDECNVFQSSNDNTTCAIDLFEYIGLIHIVPRVHLYDEIRF